MAFIAPELEAYLREQSLFDDLAVIEGETFRDVAGRRTFRFGLGGKYYFAKLHYGVGWREIIKNLVQLRLPVLGARNEWRAIKRLQSLGVQTLTPVAYASYGANPATRRSCLVTEALDETTSLEDVVINQQLTLPLKRQLLHRVGGIARTLHENGINHRDFYICHFLIPNPALKREDASLLHLIDLHRAQLRSGQAPARWREKDIAGLLFSSADAGLTRRDLLRFLMAYYGCPLREALQREPSFWPGVVKRAADLYHKDHGKVSPLLEALRALS